MTAKRKLHVLNEEEKTVATGVWKYVHGNIVPSETPFWDDDDDQIDSKTQLERLGFSKFPVLKIGDYLLDQLSIEIFARNSNQVIPNYLATVDIAGTCDDVWINDLPDLLAFIERYAPIVAALQRQQERLDAAAEQERKSEKEAA